MLDTIALTLDRHEFAVLEPGRFSPDAGGLLAPPYYKLGARGVFMCVQNPTKTDLAAGRYLPRLTLAKRKVRGGFALTLRVEFSAPKLLLGNNFDELRSQDFDAVVDRLRRLLAGMGVRVSEDTLRAARVSTIHYSKNIAFTDYTTCSMVMSELERIDLTKRLDLSQTDYRNEGHAIRYHANSFETTVYDKLKDLEQARISEKRAIERDYGAQLDILRDRIGLPRQLEVLRLEIRLGNRTKIMGVMKQIGAEVEPTFAGLFDVSIAQEVLLHFWANVRKQMPLVGQGIEKPEDILARLAQASATSARPGTLLRQLGAMLLARSIGWRGVGALMSRHCSRRSWQRYKRELKGLPLGKSKGYSALAQIQTALDRFRPLRMRNFQVEPTQGSVTTNTRGRSR